MAYYLVHARAKVDKLKQLKKRLESGEIKGMRPFGIALDESLQGAKLDKNGLAVWEENDYCNPPLAMERAAVLDHYFSDIEVQEVNKGEGWKTIERFKSIWEDSQ
jgi:hypothetical protein